MSCCQYRHQQDELQYHPYDKARPVVELYKFFKRVRFLWHDPEYSYEDCSTCYEDSTCFQRVRTQRVMQDISVDLRKIDRKDIQASGLTEDEIS